MSAVPVTLACTVIGATVGGTAGFVFGVPFCGVGALITTPAGAGIGGTIGFWTPVIAYTTIALVKGIFSLIGATFAGLYHLTSASLRGIVTLSTNHPIIMGVSVIGIGLVIYMLNDEEKKRPEFKRR